MPRYTTSPWTNIRINQLKALWADGLSCSIIGDELGVSRCAVIGKVQRLKLEPRQRGVNPLRGRTKPMGRKPTGVQTVRRLKIKQNQAPRFKCEQSIQYDEPTEPNVGQGCTLLELTAETCRWPIGDVGHPDFYFCGALTDKTYCPYHTRLAYQAAGPRRPFIPQRRAAA